MDKSIENIEILEMSLGFIRVFLGDNVDSGFSDLFDDMCDSYSVIVECQLRGLVLAQVLDLLKRSSNLYYCVVGCGKKFHLKKVTHDRCPYCLSSRIAPYIE